MDRPQEVLQDTKVLVVDDEEVLAWSIVNELKKLGCETRSAKNYQEALQTFDEFEPEVVVSDLKLPDGSGLDLLKTWKEKDPSIPFILITAHGAVESAINAVRLNAFDYLQKPFNMSSLTSAVTRAAEVAQLRRKVSRFENAISTENKGVQIIGDAPPMRELRRKVERVAASPADTVLVYGDTGTGKELVARAVHEWSAKTKGKPYIEINCASIPETLIESELFGYEKGAFTDAKYKKLGLFEIAGDGTIFLDEIGEMPLKLQAKLLRALEYRRFKRIGGVKDIEFNARIVAATNRNLLQEVAEKNFRADLYYRLNVVALHLPPLQERADDIPALCDFFLEKICQESKIPKAKIHSDAMKQLKDHSWPGNVRELRNVLQSIIIFEQPPTILPKHINLDKTAEPVLAINPPNQHNHSQHNNVENSSSGKSFRLPEGGMSLEDLERDMLVQAMQRTQYNQCKAAALLKISRHTLRYRLEKYNLLANEQ